VTYLLVAAIAFTALWLFDTIVERRRQSRERKENLQIVARLNEWRPR
jgi:hypothetical protein